MIPRNIILPKTNTKPSEYRYPENITTNSDTDIAIGGIALSDPTKGREFQLWYARIEGDEIKVRPENSVDDVFTLASPGATTVSLAFDNNMSIAVAWQAGSTSNLYHYQTLSSSFTTKVVNGTTSCKVAIDEPADFYTTLSDVIFAYTKNSSLYYTVQRERYETEHNAGSTVGRIIRMGLTEQNRFQMECG